MTGPAAPPPPAPPAPPAPAREGRSELRTFVPPFPLSPSRLAETARLGLRNLGRTKLRSLLTMLGIVFGIGAVVSMMSVTAGAGRELDRITSLGITNIILDSLKPPEEGKAGQGRDSWVREYGLRERDVRVLEGSVPRLVRVVRGHRVQARAHLGGREASPEILGVEPGFLEALNLKVAAGRPIVPLDEARLERVCVVGPRL